MKPIRRLPLVSLAGLSMACAGCREGNDRQMVYTAPRGALVRAGTNDGVRAKAPFVDVRVPASRQIPASNGVDVPIVDPQ